MIGRAHHVVIDCPDPRALAAFYSELLGLSITYESDDWVVIANSRHESGFAFQLALDHQPPSWPNPERPQQFHLDVMVDDLCTGELAVRSMGTTSLATGDHVYSDPAGHPFCLIPRPAWAKPISQTTKTAPTTKTGDPRKRPPKAVRSDDTRVED